MVLEGNHEIERDAANATFQAYTNRFRVPHKESGSPSPKYYSFDLAGELAGWSGSRVQGLKGSRCPASFPVVCVVLCSDSHLRWPPYLQTYVCMLCPVHAFFTQRSKQRHTVGINLQGSYETRI